jgi:hypothetical protein
MRLARSLLMLTLLSSTSGCQILGLVADKVAEPTVEAQYSPGKTTQLLVIAENYRAPTDSASDADRIAQLVSEELAREKVALIISQEKFALVRDLKPTTYAKMSVVDLGKAVGAQQVLYIDMGGVGVGTASGSDVLKGIGSVNVKVIDVATGAINFPKDVADGVPVSFATQLHRATPRATPDAIRVQVLVGLSGKIARLFHSYHPSDLEALDPEL